MDKPSSCWNNLWIGLLLFLLGLSLRAPQISASLWLDELHTAWTIRDGVAAIPFRARLGNQEPLYFLLPLVATRIGGWNEAALRMPSLLAGTLFPVCVFGVGTRLLGCRSAALGGACLAVIDSTNLFYSIEARPYAVVQWVALGQLAAFLLWIRLGDQDSPEISRRCGWLWCLLSLLLFHLHLTTAPLVLSQVAVASWFRWRRGATGPPQLGRILSMTVIGSLPALGLVQFVIGRRMAWATFVPLPGLRETLTVLPFGLFLALPLILLAITDRLPRESRHRSIVDDRRRRNRDTAMTCLLILFIFLTLAWCLTRLDIARLYYRRYLFCGTACLTMAGSSILALINPRFRRVAVILLMVVAILTSRPLSRLIRDRPLIVRADEDSARTVRVPAAASVAARGGGRGPDRMRPVGW